MLELVEEHVYFAENAEQFPFKEFSLNPQKDYVYNVMYLQKYSCYIIAKKK